MKKPMIRATITNSTMMTTGTMIATFTLLADCSPSDVIVVTSELDTVDGRSVHADTNQQ